MVPVTLCLTAYGFSTVFEAACVTQAVLSLPGSQLSTRRLNKMTSQSKAGPRVLSPSSKSNTSSPLLDAAGHTPGVPSSILRANKQKAGLDVDHEAISGSPSCVMTGSVPRWKARHRFKVGSTADRLGNIYKNTLLRRQ